MKKLNDDNTYEHIFSPRKFCLVCACGLLLSAGFLSAHAQINPTFKDKYTSQKFLKLKATESKSKTGELVFILNNGAIIPQTNNAGHRGKAQANGSVLFPDGIRVIPQGTYGTDIKENGNFVKRFAPEQPIGKVDLASKVVRQPSPGGSTSPSPRGSNSGSQTQNYPTGFSGSDAPYMPSRPASGGGAGSSIGERDTGNSGANPGFGTSPGQPNRPARTSTDRSGNPSFVLGNGQSVPGSINGAQGHANDKGGVDYSDGRSANVDPATGETVFTNPDGSEHSRHRPATASRSSDGRDTFTMSNGQQVPRSINGSQGRPNGEGGVTYDDGSSIHVDSDTGESVAVNPDGSELSRTDAPRAHETRDKGGNRVYRMSNGAITPRTDSSGGVGQPNDRGGVDYPDGTSTSVTSNGRSVIHSPGKGTYITVTESTDGNGNAVFDLGNGTSVPVNGEGDVGRIGRGGSAVIYPDGTEVMVDGKTGNTVIIAPDGSSTVKTPGNKKAAGDYVAAVNGSDSDNDNTSDGDDDNSESSSSEENDTDNNDDDSGTDEGSSSDDSSDDSSSDDDGGGGEDDSGDEGSSDEMRTGGNSTYGQHERKTQADDFLARKKGEDSEPDSVKPPPCEEGDGLPSPPVMDPKLGNQGGCVPAISGQNDDEGSTGPRVEDNLPANKTPKTPDEIREIVTQPGIDIQNDRLNNDGRTIDDKLEDIDAITNPDNPRL